MVALRQTVSKAGLLHYLSGSGSSHRELCRDVGLGRGGEVGDCVSQRLLVNNGRDKSVLEGVGLKGIHQSGSQVMKMEYQPCR